MLNLFRKKPTFGSPLKANTEEIPNVIYKCINFLDRKGYDAEGLFRIPGSAVVVNQYKEKFDRDDDVSLEPLADDVHTVAGLLKLYLRELPEPLCTYDHYDMFVGSMSIPDASIKRQKIKNILEYLPPINYRVIAFLVGYLYRHSRHASKNLMSSKNLAIIFAPSLMRPRDNSLATQVMDSQESVQLLENLIDNYEYYFDFKKLRDQRGYLIVRIISGRHLLPKDAKGTSDPYVTVRVGNKVQKSKVIKEQLNPCWNQEFLFDIDAQTLEIVIEVWDKDRLSDDFLGKLNFPLHTLQSNLTPKKWYKLNPRFRSERVNGELEIEIEYNGDIFFPSRSALPIDFQLARIIGETQSSELGISYLKTQTTLFTGYELYRRCLGYSNAPFRVQNAVTLALKKQQDQNVSCSGFHDLATPFLALIFSFLESNDYLHVGRVNKQWRKVSFEFSLIKFAEKVSYFIRTVDESPQMKQLGAEAAEPIANFIGDIVAIAPRFKEGIDILTKELFTSSDIIVSLSQNNNPVILLSFVRLVTLLVAFEHWKKKCPGLETIYTSHHNYKNPNKQIKSNNFIGGNVISANSPVDRQTQEQLFVQKRFYLFEIAKDTLKKPMERMDKLIGYFISVVQDRKYLTEEGIPDYLSAAAIGLILLLFFDVQKNLKNWISFVLDRGLHLPPCLVETLEDLAKEKNQLQ